MPGIAEKLMESGIRRVDATTTIDLTESETKQHLDRRGQPYAFGIVIAVLAVTVILAVLGYAREGTIIATTLVVVLAVAFLGTTSIDKIVPYLLNRPQRDASKPHQSEPGERGAGSVD